MREAFYLKILKKITPNVSGFFVTTKNPPKIAISIFYLEILHFRGFVLTLAVSLTRTRSCPDLHAS